MSTNHSSLVAMAGPSLAAVASALPTNYVPLPFTTTTTDVQPAPPPNDPAHIQLSSLDGAEAKTDSGSAGKEASTAAPTHLDHCSRNKDFTFYSERPLHASEVESILIEECDPSNPSQTRLAYVSNKSVAGRVSPTTVLIGCTKTGSLNPYMAKHGGRFSRVGKGDSYTNFVRRSPAGGANAFGSTLVKRPGKTAHVRRSSLKDSEIEEALLQRRWETRSDIDQYSDGYHTCRSSSSSMCSGRLSPKEVCTELEKALQASLSKTVDPPEDLTKRRIPCGEGQLFKCDPNHPFGGPTPFYANSKRDTAPAVVDLGFFPPSKRDGICPPNMASGPHILCMIGRSLGALESSRGEVIQLDRRDSAIDHKETPLMKREKRGCDSMGNPLGPENGCPNRREVTESQQEVNILKRGFVEEQLIERDPMYTGPISAAEMNTLRKEGVACAGSHSLQPGVSCLQRREVSEWQEIVTERDAVEAASSMVSKRDGSSPSTMEPIARLDDRLNKAIKRVATASEQETALVKRCAPTPSGMPASNCGPLSPINERELEGEDSALVKRIGCMVGADGKLQAGCPFSRDHPIKRSIAEERALAPLSDLGGALLRREVLPTAVESAGAMRLFKRAPILEPLPEAREVQEKRTVASATAREKEQHEFMRRWLQGDDHPRAFMLRSEADATTNVLKRGQGGEDDEKLATRNAEDEGMVARSLFSRSCHSYSDRFKPRCKGKMDLNDGDGYYKRGEEAAMEKRVEGEGEGEGEGMEKRQYDRDEYSDTCTDYSDKRKPWCKGKMHLRQYKREEKEGYEKRGEGGDELERRSNGSRGSGGYHHRSLEAEADEVLERRSRGSSHGGRRYRRDEQEGNDDALEKRSRGSRGSGGWHHRGLEDEADETLEKRSWNSHSSGNGGRRYRRDEQEGNDDALEKRSRGSRGSGGWHHRGLEDEVDDALEKRSRGSRGSGRWHHRSLEAEGDVLERRSYGSRDSGRYHHRDLDTQADEELERRSWRSHSSGNGPRNRREVVEDEAELAKRQTGGEPKPKISRPLIWPRFVDEDGWTVRSALSEQGDIFERGEEDLAKMIERRGQQQSVADVVAKREVVPEAVPMEKRDLASSIWRLTVAPLLRRREATTVFKRDVS